MHFYPHNIPDFNNATRHLTRVERSVYRDTLDMYYDTESPLPSDNFDRLCRVLLCVTDEEKSALRTVLDEFYVLTEAGHYHARCEHEIAKYRSNSTAKARAGKASAEARKNKCKTQVEHVLNSVEQNNNQEIINNNQEIISLLPASQEPAAPKKQKKIASRLPDDWKPEKQHWDAAVEINPDFTREWFVLTAHKFKDYWIAKSGKDATKADWLATWRNWVRNDLEYSRGKVNAQPRQQLDDNNTDWITRVYQNGGTGEHDFQVTESDIPGLAFSDSNAGGLRPSQGGMAKGADGEWDKH